MSQRNSLYFCKLEHVAAPGSMASGLGTQNNKLVCAGALSATTMNKFSRQDPEREQRKKNVLVSEDKIYDEPCGAGLGGRRWARNE